MTVSRRAVLAGAGAALFAPRVFAAETIKLEISAFGLPFADARVGDRAVKAMIDTAGTVPLQVSSRLAASLKLANGASPRFTLGGRSSAEHVTIVDGEIEKVGEQVGTEFDAIVGWPYLARTAFAMDYASSSLLLDDTVDPASTWNMSLVATAPLPVVDMLVEGQPLRALVDTGAPTSLLDPRRADASPVGVMLQKLATLSGRETRLRFRIQDLGLIRTKLGCEAVLGHSFLAAYRVRFDRPAGRIALQS
ncbi:hypothetical protein [Roseiterribacter gracilis]|uniref:Peptidase A2 domain-containing protein n=1 Tax=Roseiterribacter gracilis TaxID=2812848 RepID=A0A8S8XAB6_9PROT|nr:hypothetical protein TMPK1_10380 [Rhodospirillales bacterium TMPK1]